MKWLHVLGHLRSGGVEVRLMWTLRGLKPGYEHVLVSLDGSTDVLDQFPDVRDRVRVIDAPHARSRSGRRLRRWITHLLSTERPDAVLSYGWGAFDVPLAAVLYRSRLPVFHFEDGFTAEEAERMPLRRTFARRFVLPRVAATVVPSSTLAALAMNEWNVPAGRVVHVPNGIPPSESRGSLDLHARFDLVANAPVCISVGRLAKVKRVELAIDAAAAAGASLVVLGEGPEEPWLRRHAEASRSRVLFAGLQSDVRPWLRGADIYLSLSGSEQHPIAMLEAMDEGLPVVATDVGDVAVSLPSEQQPFIVRAESPVAAAIERIAALGSDPSKRASLGALNRRRVAEHFRFETALSAVEAAILDRCSRSER